MTQQGKAGVFLLSLIAFGLVAYIIFSTKNETINFEKRSDLPMIENDDKVNDLEKISQAEIESNYQSDLREAIASFESKISALEGGLPDDSLAATGTEAADPADATATGTEAADLEMVLSDIADFKIAIMDMTVPAELRDLHFSLVKALTDQKEAIMATKTFKSSELLAITSEAKSQYEWLRN